MKTPCVWTVHAMPGPVSPERVGVIPDRTAILERLVAFVAPLIWLIWRRNWLILVVYLAVVPIVQLQLIQARTGINSGLLASESAGWIDAAALMSFLTFSLLCAWQPGVISRLDKRLRGWRYIWTVTAIDRAEALQRWQEEQADAIKDSSR